jgi:hypothetical protein
MDQPRKLAGICIHHDLKETARILRHFLVIAAVELGIKTETPTPSSIEAAFPKAKAYRNEEANRDIERFEVS